MKTYVINLDQDTARLAFLTASFNKLGIEFERVSAVDGRKFSDEAFQDFVRLRPRHRQKSEHKNWLRGQMGCFLSHYHAWQKIAAGDERFGTVFEDDLHVSDELQKILADDSWIPDDVDLIRLDTSTNRVRLSSTPDLTHLGRTVYGVKSTSWCTGGYIIHRRTAQALIDLEPSAHEPSDVLLYNFEHSSVAKNFRILQFQPALCTQDKHLASGKNQFASNIEFPDNQPSAWQQKLSKVTPSALVKALYRSLCGYKRIGFQ